MVRGFVAVKRLCGDRMKAKAAGLRSWELLAGFLHIDDSYQMVAGTPRPAGLHFSGRKDKTVKLTVSTWKVRTKLDNKARPERRTVLIAKKLDR